MFSPVQSLTGRVTGRIGAVALFPPFPASAWPLSFSVMWRPKLENQQKMKQKNKRSLHLSPLLAGCLLAASMGTGLAQTWANPKTFDSSKGSWITWNGWGMQDDGTMLTWDSTLNVPNDAAMAEGSLRYAFPFVGASDEQMMTFGTLADRWGWDSGTVINCAGNFKALEMDFKLDPATQPTKSGNFGTIQLGLIYLSGQDWKQLKCGELQATAASTSWTHLTFPIDQTAAGLDTVVGYYIYLWSGGEFTNTLMFNVDNIYLKPSTDEPPPPPPTMGLLKAGATGVRVIMDDKNAQWQRNAIATPLDGGPYLWTSQGSYPVSYSCTIAQFPDAVKHYGFEAHMYLVNGDTGGGSQTSGSPDWGVPDLLIFRLENRAEGDALAMIQWKTNYPNANATNVPVSVAAPSAIGTWTVTFTDATHGSLTGPGITATNFTLPADVVANNFSPSTSYVQFGMFKADGPNDGHNNDAYGTFSRVQFTGAAAPFDDDFSGATLTNKYAWRTTSPTSIQYVPPGTAWDITWTTPASGFNATMAASPNGPWTPAKFTSTYRDSAKLHGLIAQSALPGTNASYFRLVKRPFVKLQVLMPGETAAPNTTSGKTGTPTPQAPGVPFNVIVNAVDEFWNVVSSSDMVTITSSDEFAVLPADAELANGTKTFSVTFNNTGAFTVTATDVTDNTKTANTGTATTTQ